VGVAALIRTRQSRGSESNRPNCTPCQREGNGRAESGRGRAGVSMHGMGAGNERRFGSGKDFWRAGPRRRRRCCSGGVLLTEKCKAGRAALG
jgi:hypothetical protein